MAKGEIFEGLPGWAKGVIAVAVVGGGAYLIYELQKGVKNIKKNAGSKSEAGAVTTELNTLNTASSTKQTLSPAQATAMANMLFTAMDGYGTDSVTIMKQLLQLKNQADWLAVNNAYGVRTLSSGRFNPEPDFTGTLTASLANELGVLDAELQQGVNKQFAARGIKAVI